MGISPGSSYRGLESRLRAVGRRAHNRMDYLRRANWVRLPKEHSSAEAAISFLSRRSRYSGLACDWIHPGERPDHIRHYCLRGAVSLERAHLPYAASHALGAEPDCRILSNAYTAAALVFTRRGIYYSALLRSEWNGSFSVAARLRSGGNVDRLLARAVIPHTSDRSLECERSASPLIEPRPSTYPASADLRHSP